MRVRHGIVLRHRVHGPRMVPGRFLRLRRRHGFIDRRRVGRAVGVDDGHGWPPCRQKKTIPREMRLLPCAPLISLPA